MDITVVLPVYNERGNLVQLLDELAAALDPSRRAYEIIAVDDGSTDGSAALLHHLAETNPRLKVVFFRHNYGQAAAFDAGFRAASGKLLVTMDADLQND